MKTALLAHYYAPIEVQVMADHVGDSLDLSLKARESNADRIVFAGVRFMAETAKILNPRAEVVLPHEGSTCSLVEQTDEEALYEWVARARVYFEQRPVAHVAYINSSARHKALADWVVTSRNVQDIVQHLHETGHQVLFSPDRNMGAYLNYLHPDWDIRYWSAVCEVHDKFKIEEIEQLFRVWTDGPKYLIAHPESPLPVLQRADFVGSTKQMLDWIDALSGHAPDVVPTVYVGTELELIDIMRRRRPDLSIHQAPVYTGCQCNVCPYMKLNSVTAVKQALEGGGEIIDYLTELDMRNARKPIQRMMEFEA